LLLNGQSHFSMLRREGLVRGPHQFRINLARALNPLTCAVRHISWAATRSGTHSRTQAALPLLRPHHLFLTPQKRARVSETWSQRTSAVGEAKAPQWSLSDDTLWIVKSRKTRLRRDANEDLMPVLGWMPAGMATNLVSTARRLRLTIQITQSAFGPTVLAVPASIAAMRRYPVPGVGLPPPGAVSCQPIFCRAIAEALMS